MKIEEFPACCGIEVLTDLDSWAGFKVPGTTKDRQYNHGYEEEHYRLAILQQLDQVPAYKLIMATTAGQPEADDTLVAVGFEELKQFRNPNSGNIVRVYAMLCPGNIQALIKAEGKRLTEYFAKKAKKSKRR